MLKTSVIIAVLFTAFLFSGKTAFTQSDSTKPITGKTCIVTGEAIDEGMGEQFTYLGKTYDFCCKNCVKKFKTEPLDYIKEGVSCPVTGEPANKDVFTVVDNVKYYFCCKGCSGKFEKEPEKFLKK
jgi:YHS domain-containing protein